MRQGGESWLCLCQHLAASALALALALAVTFVLRDDACTQACLGFWACKFYTHETPLFLHMHMRDLSR